MVLVPRMLTRPPSLRNVDALWLVPFDGSCSNPAYKRRKISGGRVVGENAEQGKR